MVSGRWLRKAVRCTTSRTKTRFDFFFTFDSVSTGLIVGGLTKKVVENRWRPHKVGGVSRKAGFLCIQVAGSHYSIPSAFGGINGTLHVELH